MSVKRYLIPIFVVLTFILQLAMPGLARAEDGTPPDPSVTEVPVDPGTGEEPSASVPEILAQIPDETGVVVVNLDGSSEPLATQAAVEAIANSDPVWCPGLALPGNPLCTTNQASVTALIDYLLDPDGDPGTPTPYTGGGTIYFQNGVYGGTETMISFSSSTLPGLTDLGLVGGWDLGTNTPVTGGLTTFNVPVVLDWNANVLIQDVTVDADFAGYGLVISTEGNVELTNVDALNNSLGSGASIDTCLLEDIDPDPLVTEWACTGTGTVSITDSAFDANAADGLLVEAGGSINAILVSASDNGFWGAALDNVNGTGSVMIGSSQFDDNGSNGLIVWTSLAILMDHTSVSGNYDGADLNADDAISITSSDFVGNDSSGLWAGTSFGNVNLTSVTVSDNMYGAIVGTDEGDVDVVGGLFTNNFTLDPELDGYGFGLQAGTSLGNVTLTNVTATGNDIGVVAGAYQGDVDIVGGSFNDNNYIGLEAGVWEGSLTLTNVTAGNTVPGPTATQDWGVYLGNQNGPVTVSGGIFDGNLEKGLYIESTGGIANPVTLDDVQASGNGLKGAYISYYAPCGTTTGGVTVNVIDGLYQTNGAYGIYGMVGPEGSVTLDTLVPPDFGTHNGTPPDSLYDLLVNTDVIPCPPPCEPKPVVEAKPYHIIEVPETGGSPVEQNCIDYSGTMLILPGQDKVLLACPAEGSVEVGGLTVEQLPAPVPGGPQFLAALEVTLLDEDQQPIPVITNGGSIDVAFKVPEDARPNDRFSILYWDPAAQNGAGGWFELPQYRETLLGRSIVSPLHPDLLPDDLMRILSGVRSLGGYIKASVNFPGVFALIRR